MLRPDAAFDAPSSKLNEDIVVPRGRLTDLAAFAETLRKKYGYPIACFGHAGDGNIHVNIMAAGYHENTAVEKKVGAALDELFADGAGLEPRRAIALAGLD